jgi:hypothetical protein
MDTYNVNCADTCNPDTGCTQTCNSGYCCGDDLNEAYDATSSACCPTGQTWGTTGCGTSVMDNGAGPPNACTSAGFSWYDGPNWHSTTGLAKCVGNQPNEYLIKKLSYSSTLHGVTWT